MLLAAAPPALPELLPQLAPLPLSVLDWLGSSGHGLLTDGIQEAPKWGQADSGPAPPYGMLVVS